MAAGSFPQTLIPFINCFRYAAFLLIITQALNSRNMWSTLIAWLFATVYFRSNISERPGVYAHRLSVINPKNPRPSFFKAILMACSSASLILLHRINIALSRISCSRIFEERSYFAWVQLNRFHMRAYIVF